MGLGVFLSCLPLSFAALWDYKWRIIPNWTVFLIFCCAALNIVLGQAALTSCAIGLLAIGLPLWLMAARGVGIGGGDVKLCAALGALLGLERMLLLLPLALCFLLLTGKLHKKKSMPFAPHLWGAFYILLTAEIFQRS